MTKTTRLQLFIFVPAQRGEGTNGRPSDVKVSQQEHRKRRAGRGDGPAVKALFTPFVAVLNLQDLICTGPQHSRMQVGCSRRARSEVKAVRVG